MTKTHVIENIILLPKKFQEENVSIYFLLKESGYFEQHNQISEKDISEKLIQYLELIEEWINLSENNRSNCGWYFKLSNNRYIVGYFTLKKKVYVTEYVSKIDACAAFIKRKIEEIRNNY